MASAEVTIEVKISQEGLDHLQAAEQILRAAGDVIGLGPNDCRRAIEELQAAAKCLTAEKPHEGLLLGPEASAVLTRTMALRGDVEPNELLDALDSLGEVAFDESQVDWEQPDHA